MDTSKEASRIQTTCLVILSTIAVAFAIYWLKPVLIPFVLALFLAIGLAPVVNLLVKHLRLPRVLSVMVTLILAVLVLALLGVIITGSLRGLTTNAETYQTRMQKVIDQAVELLPLESLGINREQLLQPFSQISGEAVRDLMLNTGGAVANLVSNGVLVLIFLCFIMFGRSSRAMSIGRDWGEIESNLRRYIIVKAILSVATGFLVGLALWILDIELAVLFGLLAFLLNFIPSIGSILGVVLPIPVILMTPGISLTTIILAIAIPGAVEFVIGNIIEPRLMGKRFDLHPIVIMMALIFWGMLWGVIGMFLATPLMVVARLLLQEREMTRPIGELLSGRMGQKPAERPSAEQT